MGLFTSLVLFISSSSYRGVVYRDRPSQPIRYIQDLRQGHLGACTAAQLGGQRMAGRGSCHVNPYPMQIGIRKVHRIDFISCHDFHAYAL